MAVSCTAIAGQAEKVSLDPSKQKTLKKSVSISGSGLFTAEKAVLTIIPASVGNGIVFRRKDLPGSPLVPADLDRVVSTPRCTILGTKECTIHTVEHVLAALYALEIDNAVLELTGPEVPIVDGSSAPFVEAILTAGILQQGQREQSHFLQKPVSWSKDDVHIVAVPAEEFSISYTLHYPQSKVLQSQYHQTKIDAKTFSREIAPCRTFCLYEEITPFIESGLIKGGGLNNAVIIKDDLVVNPEGIRFQDEMVRHKILDLLGDLSLIPIPFTAHIIAIRSGHSSNIAFARVLYDHIKMEKQ